mmetsp:Transcript_29286/g.93651  ORF Transcript_29286/g.93651 Transcript_29286/m.93651 type:complete len:86 (-) Transcript_29286:513-770(-)
MGRYPASGLCRLGSCVTWPLEALRSNSTPCALECLWARKPSESSVPLLHREEPPDDGCEDRRSSCASRERPTLADGEEASAAAGA